VNYAEEWKSKDATAVASQLKRLEGLKGGKMKMKPDLLDWVKKRIAVLKQYPFAPPEVWKTCFLHFFLFPNVKPFIELLSLTVRTKSCSDSMSPCMSSKFLLML
jgi:hypothetical protein